MIGTRALRAVAAVVLLLAAAGCERKAKRGPIVVALVGNDAAIQAAVGRGIVRLDAEGQIVPDAAARWAISPDGRDYIFRIDEGLRTRDVAARLRAVFRRRSVPRLLAGPDPRIEAVTATVVELRLGAPAPDLLPLLAQQVPALLADGGPMRPVRRGPQTALIGEAATLLVRPERIGRAVARFAAGDAQVVLGGTFADLPVARVATLPAGTLRFDPAAGLFGFAVEPGSAASDPAVARALALAIDRDRIVAAIDAPGQSKAARAEGGGEEAPLRQRVAEARGLLAGRTPIALAVAMPEGPAARRLLALVTQDWSRIGVELRPAAKPKADLRFVDLVVPTSMQARLGCAISAGCDAGNGPAFVAIASPVRWSLVAAGIAGHAENALAAHPLETLRRR